MVLNFIYQKTVNVYKNHHHLVKEVAEQTYRASGWILIFLERSKYSGGALKQVVWGGGTALQKI